VTAGNSSDDLDGLSFADTHVMFIAETRVCPHGMVKCASGQCFTKDSYSTVPVTIVAEVEHGLLTLTAVSIKKY
jgi:hypothetical protein